MPYLSSLKSLTTRGRTAKRKSAKRTPRKPRLARFEGFEAREMLANAIFAVPGATTDRVSISFDLTGKAGGFKNEIAVYKVQDDSGRVNGLAPGDSGYAAAAFANSQLVFARGGKVGAHREFVFAGGDRLAFVLVQNQTLARLWDRNPNDLATGRPLGFFSFDNANPDRFAHVRDQRFVDGSRQFSWEDLTGGGDQDFNDLVFHARVTGAVALPAPSGASPTPAKFTLLSRAAGRQDEVGYFLTDSADGRIGNLRPGDRDYARTALAEGRRVTLFAANQAAGATSTHDIPSGGFVGLYMISGGTTPEFLARNSSNRPQAKKPQAMFSFMAANPDRREQLRWLNSTDVGFEDSLAHRRRDFRDVVMRIELNANQDVTAPVITARLANDTGVATDRITSDPTISGTIADASPIVTLMAGFDDANTPDLMDDISDLLGAGGAFSISRARLTTLHGGTLDETEHTLHLSATDDHGNISKVTDLTFTLDSTGPTAPTADLAPASDTGTVGDRRTNLSVVTLAGVTDPLSTVRIVGGATTTADSTGHFQFTNTNLAVGDNVFTIQATDQTGNSSSTQLTVVRNSAPTVASPTPDASIPVNSPNKTIDLSTVFADADIQNTRVQFSTTLGKIDVELSDTITPLTVANFLNYTNAGRYDNTIIHRNPVGFVAQGGGFKFNETAHTLTHIATDPAVQNEFSQSNIRGTIAMAKLGSDPNSATSEWFFNLGDNSQNLNNQNGGFTVFGRVIGSAGLTTLDAINATPKFSPNGPNGAFADIPLRNFSASSAFPSSTTLANYVSVDSVDVTRRRDRLTFTATSSDTNVATVSIANNVLTIAYPTNATGLVTITVTATDLDGATVQDSFQITVGP